MKSVLDFLKSKFICNRTIGFFIGLASALLSVIFVLLFYLLNLHDLVTTSHEGLSPTLTLIFILMGAVSFLIVALVKNERGGFLLSLIPVILSSLGLAIHINLMSYPLADRFTGVSFFGGSAPLFVTFGILLTISTIGLVVSTFSPQNK